MKIIKTWGQILCILSFLALPMLACKQKFSLQTQGKLSSFEILEQITQECRLSLIFQDSFAKDALLQNKPQLYAQSLDLDSFLALLLEEAGLHYSLQDKVLRLSYLYSKTYELNYVSTSRVGSSSTDVVLSHNPNPQESTPHLGDDQNQITQKAPNLNTHQNFQGRSGTKILSIDANNFWGEIQKEIQEIAYRPEDSSNLPKSITINKQAGLLTITATKPQHQRIQTYLDQLNAKMHAQVLIDVHILTITHHDSRTAGINWSEFYKLGNLAIPPPQIAPSFIQLGSQGINMGLTVLSQGVSLNRIIEFLESYGKTRSLSNPKVLTLNNQPAIISVGSVLRYTQNTIYQSSSQGSNIQNSIENYPSIFAGVLLDVTPSIQGEEIILKINPSITRTKNASLENEPNALKTPPNLSTNQLSSLVKIRSGEKVVLGGLISNFQSKKEFKIPLLGDIPLLNLLFKYNWSNELSEEMVIVISPKILRPAPKTAQKDFSSQFKALIQEIQIQSLQETPPQAIPKRKQQP